MTQKYAFAPHRIFNADEAGGSFVPVKSKILSARGKKQVGG
jgi:hypothetical protein